MNTSELQRLDEITERRCSFNCDAESNCTCTAHLMRRELAAALLARSDQPDFSKLSKDEIAHSLTLQFGRVLEESEWREVVEAARRLPFVQGLEAKVTRRDAPPAQDRTEHWAVEVRRNGENLVTIESNCLSGQAEFSDAEAETIRDAAQHLRSFIGVGRDAPQEQTERTEKA